LPFVVADGDGKPLTERLKSDNKNDTIARHWNRLLARVEADYPRFHRLSFKFLRKTGGNLIRHMDIANATELTSMYHSRSGTADSADSLLPVYTSRPWKRLHRALLKLRKKLQPMFAAVERPWEGRGTTISPGTIAKIKELRTAGKTLTEIAQVVGLHHITVGKLARR
jgi:hypothetical protein